MEAPGYTSTWVYKHLGIQEGHTTSQLLAPGYTRRAYNIAAISTWVYKHLGIQTPGYTRRAYNITAISTWVYKKGIQHRSY
jgi:hypothetical protein